MAKRAFSLSKVYGLLEPGPVVLVTTAGKTGPNIMTLSWYTMLDFEPPLVGCVVSDRNHSFGLLRAMKECVINIPTIELAQAVVACGNSTGRDTDKFAEFGLTASHSTTVSPPRIRECYANLECVVADTRMVNRYGLFVLEVLKASVDTAVKNPRTLHHRGWGSFMVAGETINLPSGMR